MLPYLQNKINVAIRHGIKLGLNLYDEDIQDISNDLATVNGSHISFKKLDIFKHIDDDVIEFLNNNEEVFWKFEILCNEYEDEFYAKYFIEDNPQLLYKLIVQLCKSFGNSINLNWIDVSNISNMAVCEIGISPTGMFSFTDFDGDISQWDVSNVKDMSSLFEFSKFNGDISKWDVSNVRDMSNMFSNSVFNGDLSKWDVRQVENMSSMFANSKFDGDLSKWNVSNVKNMYNMFYNSLFNGDLSKWDVSQVENMNLMFAHSKFTGNISKWNIDNVCNMAWMFSETNYNCDLSKWNLSKVKYKFDIFKNCKIKNQFKPKGLKEL